MVTVKICVKQVERGECEVATFIEGAKDDESDGERGIAMAIAKGLQVLMGEMRDMGKLTHLVTFDDPASELARRVKAKFRRKGEA